MFCLCVCLCARAGARPCVWFARANGEISMLGDSCKKALIEMSAQPPLALLWCVFVVSEARRRLTSAEPRAPRKIRLLNSFDLTSPNPFLYAETNIVSG